jgi:tripartite-type tricarboxylate transporter receptor subunit TctC
MFRLPRLLAFAAAVALAAPALAQTYPSKPVKILVPFAAGGIADITTRFVADRLGAKLGQQFVVENKPGPGGIEAARSALAGGADGHTLALLTNGTAISVGLFNNLRYDPVKEFVPVSGIGQFDFVFATGADSRFKTLGDVIRESKEKPGSLNVGTVAVGSTQHLSSELFKSMAGIDIKHVPYRTTADVLLGAIRGDVAIVVEPFATMKANIEDGKLRALGVSANAPSPFLPGVPPVAAAVPGFDVPSWNALFAPAGTPPAVIETLNRAMVEILADADMKKKMFDVGIEAKATTPAEMGAKLQSEITRWAGVIEKAGIAKQ